MVCYKCLFLVIEAVLNRLKDDEFLVVDERAVIV